MEAYWVGDNIMKVVLDTNFLFLPFYEHFDIVSEIKKKYSGAKIIVLEDVINELAKLKRKEVNEYISKRKIRIVDYNIDEKDVDKKILKYADEHNAFIGTMDKDLKKKAFSKNIKIISFLKSKKRLIIPKKKELNIYV